AESSAVIFYVFAYSIMTIGAFGVVSVLEKDEDTFITVEHVRGLASRNPVIAACFSIFLLSLAGVPPMVGFFGKFFLFASAINQGLYWLVIWGVIGSVISVFYYLRPIVAMYMSQEEGLSVLSHRTLTQGAIVISAGMVLVFGFFSDPVYRLMAQLF
ncbi:MAG: NADH-quinone oxidoreductase subunit N, partial [Bdellovibrionales bacterium]|nr:NADH-quinone oxidoreductase subunit N [Bdellovibrionales bacterium]